MAVSAELLLTPTDEGTGLPYCFVPPPDLPLPPPKGGNLDRQGDWNHQFPKAEVRYSDNPALDDLGRLALLSSRIQWVDFGQHHDVYNLMYKGPEQPQTPRELFKTLIMAEAGYIPERAIDLSGSEPEEVAISQEQRRYLWESGQVKVRDSTSVRAFLFRYVLEQDVDHIHSRQLDEFLHTTDPDRRIQLGHYLTAKIVERAVEPIDSVYRNARTEGVLPAQAVPHIRDFVKPRLRVGRNFHKVMSELHRRLKLHEAQVAA